MKKLSYFPFRAFALSIVTLLCSLGTPIAIMAVDPAINIQGILRDADNKAVADGNYSLEFKIYDAAANGNLLCSETHTNVKITNGVYNVTLGTSNEFKALPFNKQYFVGIAVNGGAVSSPLVALSVSPYSRSVVGTDNNFPPTGQVTIGGGSWMTNKLWIKKGGIEIQNDDEDNQIRFHDPYNNHYYLGTDKSDENKLKIGRGAVVGEKDYVVIDYNGNTTINGPIRQSSFPSSYDVWIQGNTRENVEGDGRNLAILGINQDNGDQLIVNYNNEYKNGTVVGSNLDVAGKISIYGNSPIVIRSYEVHDYAINGGKGTDTGVDIDTYSAIVVGFDKGDLDYQEIAHGYATRVMCYPGDNGKWWVSFNERANYQNITEGSLIHVMFIRKQLCSDERDKYWLNNKKF